MTFRLHRCHTVELPRKWTMFATPSEVKLCSITQMQHTSRVQHLSNTIPKQHCSTAQMQIPMFDIVAAEHKNITAHIFLIEVFGADDVFSISNPGLKTNFPTQSQRSFPSLCLATNVCNPPPPQHIAVLYFYVIWVV